MENDPSCDAPSIPADKRNAINRDHFTNNQYLSLVLKPVIDCIALLEPASAHIGQIWEGLIRCYTDIRKLELPSRFSKLQDHALSVLNARAKEFTEDIYLIGFFLNPNYRKVAITKMTTIRDMQRMILAQARKWNTNLSMVEGKNVVAMISSYYNGERHFSNNVTDGKIYWNCLAETVDTRDLKRFAMIVFSLSPHSAGIERMFST
jgi:hypothetical protein